MKSRKFIRILIRLILLFVYQHRFSIALNSQHLREGRSLFSSNFPVTPNEARLVVSISSYFRNVVQYCSGTLLTNRLVLTAAHCLYINDTGLASQVRVTNEGWSYYVQEYVIRRDFVRANQPENFIEFLSRKTILTLTPEKSTCADMALLFLPIPVPGFFGPNGIKYSKLQPTELLKEAQKAEIVALGYGVTEFDRVSVLPRKVPMQLISANSECTLNFLFTHSAISCSGDSGGPVLYYPKNATKSKQFSKIPVYLGISIQIAIYDIVDKNARSIWTKQKERQPFGAMSSNDRAELSKNGIEDCKRAKELSILQTYYVQRWLHTLVQNEKDANRRSLYNAALKSLIGQ